MTLTLISNFNFQLKQKMGDFSNGFLVMSQVGFKTIKHLIPKIFVKKIMEIKCKERNNEK